MKCLRIYATPDGESHIGEVDVPLPKADLFAGRPPVQLSSAYPASGVQIVSIPAGVKDTGSSEAINLSWDDVDLRERRIIIRKTKNGNPHTINLTSELVAALANLPKSGSKVFKFAARWSVYGSWRRACKKAGIEYIPPHQAGRHAFATEMIVRNGVDVGTTAKLGNWKSVKLLLDNYVHAENDAAVVESVFGTPTAHKRDKALK